MGLSMKLERATIDHKLKIDQTKVSNLSDQSNYCVVRSCVTSNIRYAHDPNLHLELSLKLRCFPPVSQLQCLNHPYDADIPNCIPYGRINRAHPKLTGSF